MWSTLLTMSKEESAMRASVGATDGGAPPPRVVRPSAALRPPVARYFRGRAVLPPSRGTHAHRATPLLPRDAAWLPREVACPPREPARCSLSHGELATVRSLAGWRHERLDRREPRQLGRPGADPRGVGGVR